MADAYSASLSEQVKRCCCSRDFVFDLPRFSHGGSDALKVIAIRSLAKHRCPSIAARAAVGLQNSLLNQESFPLWTFVCIKFRQILTGEVFCFLRRIMDMF